MPITSANMGYVGWVKFLLTGGDAGFIRATTCDLKVTQTIEKPEVVDGTIDRTVYKLGPKEIGGSVAFPAVMEQGLGASGTAMSNLWNAAIVRSCITGDTQGGFATMPFSVVVKYSNNTVFEYTECVVDNYEWSVTQSDVVNVKVNLIGINRVGSPPPAYPASTPSSYNGIHNTRIITWADVVVKAGLVDTSSVRSFTCTVANNVKRYYSLNGSLTPQVLTPTKRDISGKLSVIGRSSISDSADLNAGNCSTDQTIAFAVNQIGTCNNFWGVKFDGLCIFEYEEIALTNELFETTVNYHVLPGETFGDCTGNGTDNYVITSI